MSLHKYSWRSMRKRPGRTILTGLSIVIGVAAVVSVDITTATTRGAYQRMFATVTGRASVLVEGEGEAAFDEGLVARVQAVPGVEAAVPVVRRYSVLYVGQQRLRLQLLGIDPERDTLVRDYAVNIGRPLQGGKEILLDETLAERLKVRVGDEVRLLTKRGIRPLSIRVVGLFQLQGASALRHAGLAFLPLRTAQAWFDRRGKIDMIQVVAQDSVPPETLQARLAPQLPAGIRAHLPRARTNVMQETLVSSEQGLRITSACSLLLASFIILNTFLINVGERRRQLSILRAIGATRRQIVWAVLRESLLLGTLGTAVGVGIGLLAAYYLNRLLSGVLDVPLPPAELSAKPFLLAVGFGLGISVVGAFVPAWRAGRISPLEGMDRVAPEDLSRGSRVYILVGLLLILVSAVPIALSIVGWLATDLGVVAAMGLLVGVVLIAPLFLEPFARLAVLVLGTVSRVESGLAVRQILRHRARSSLTAGVLFVAGSTGLAMSHSILDNVRNIRDWYRQILVADFFVRSMAPDMSTGLAPDLPDELGAALRQVPHVTGVEGASILEGRSGETGFVVIASELRMPPRLDLVAGDRRRIGQQMQAGQVVIGSVLAQRLRLGLGDFLELDTSQGPRKLPICGVANDYFAGGLTVQMSRDVAVKLLGVEGFDVYLLQAEPQHLPEVRAQLQAVCNQYGVLLHSFTEIARMIDTMIRGIVGCLWALVALGFAVGAFGVVNTLTMSVLEQTRELGLLRIVAMTKRQVRRTILTQALIIGAVGFTPGIIAGIGIAYVMNLAMLPTLGHWIPFGFHPWLALATLLGALASTSVAAWIPARRAANLDLVQALHYE